MIPHVTHFDKTDITDLEAFRKQQNAEAEKRKLDVKFTPVVFIMKAVAAALEQMPRFNSSLSEDGQKLTLKKYINIGVAVDTPNGLVDRQAGVGGFHCGDLRHILVNACTASL
jgi:pyruvate dehydrogenase E2 component (dihydrolipoamide acetyltransferase)